MRLFGLNIKLDKPRNPAIEGTRAVSRNTWQSPYTSSFRYVLADENYTVYQLLRNTIPCLDTAVKLIANLVGELEIVAEEPLKSELDNWMNTVKVNQLQQGLKTAQGIHVRAMLSYGHSGIEVVPNNAGDDIYALFNIPTQTLAFSPQADDPLNLKICQYQIGSGIPVELPVDWIVVGIYNPEEKPQGVSLFRSLPFVGEILSKMEDSLRLSWERFGTPRFHVSWDRPENFTDSDGKKSEPILAAIAAKFANTMEYSTSGQVQDFVTSGDVKVEIIGAGQDVLTFSAPYRDIMEQIVGATGLPAWMLGFTWSTTERLSDNQADILNAMLESIRLELEPDWKRILTLVRDIRGLSGDFDLKWKSISLRDATEQARADLLKANADKGRQSVGAKLWEAGVYDQAGYAEYVLGEDWDGTIKIPMLTPPADLALQGGSSSSSGGGGGSSSFNSKKKCDCHSEFAVVDGNAQVSIGKGEQPRDKKTMQAINGMYGDIVSAWRVLKQATWKAFGFDVSKFDTIRNQEPYTYTPEQWTVFHDAVDQFLTTMFGKERTKLDYINAQTGDGIVQQWDRFAWALGNNQAAEMTGAANAMLTPDRDSAAVKRMLSNGFERLSDNGAIRLEADMGNIGAIITQGAEIGLNPLDVASDLSDKFDSYEDWEFERLARTEIAFAQNTGQIDEFEAEGYNTEAIADNYPPYHPNCMCDLTVNPVTREVIPNVSDGACELCLDYAVENTGI